MKTGKQEKMTTKEESQLEWKVMAEKSKNSCSGVAMNFVLVVQCAMACRHLRFRFRRVRNVAQSIGFSLLYASTAEQRKK